MFAFVPCLWLVAALDYSCLTLSGRNKNGRPVASGYAKEAGVRMHPRPFFQPKPSYFFGCFTTVIVNDDGYCLE